MEHGANINARTDKSFTALHLAAVMREKEVVKFLIAKGIDVHAKVEQNLEKGMTALNLAANRYDAVFKSLLKATEGAALQK